MPRLDILCAVFTYVCMQRNYRPVIYFTVTIDKLQMGDGDNSVFVPSALPADAVYGYGNVTCHDGILAIILCYAMFYVKYVPDLLTTV